MQHLQAYLQCAPSSFCIHRDTLEVREEAAFTLQPKSAGFSQWAGGFCSQVSQKKDSWCHPAPFNMGT